MKTEEIINIAIKAGEILLTSGAEIYRVEDTITRICKSYGMECESFVLPTGIFISAKGSGHETISSIKRIKDRTVNLHRIELINMFSRNLQQNPVSYFEAVKALNDIKNMKGFNFITHAISAGIAAFAFTLLFKGRINEGIAACIISIVIFVIKWKISEIGFFQFFEFFISGLIAAVISLAAVRILPDLNIYQVIIGSIVILLPGVAITNGIKDALYGDIVSSLSRLGEAVLVAIAVGAGVGIVLSVGLRWV